MIAVVVAVAVVGLFSALAHRGQEGEVAIVSLRGEVYREISLAQVESPYELTVEGDCTVVLGVSSEGVCFLHSECPDGLCVNEGVVSYVGESAACLPARVSVKLVSATESPEVDAVVG